MAGKGEVLAISGAKTAVGNASLLDVLDNVLNHGVVLEGDLVLGVANIDLIYVRLSLLLASVDRLNSPARAPARAPKPVRLAVRRRR